MSHAAAPLVNVYSGVSKAPSSQTEEDDFSGGAWAVMKAEMGLDEGNPSCFLQSYSVIMVLRKVTCCDITPVFSSKPENMEEKVIFLAHVSALLLYTEGNVLLSGSGSLFLLFSSIIIDCVSLLEVCRHNQDK